MDVIVVNDYACVQGGASQVAITSARGLANHGVNVTYVFGAGDVDPSLKHPNINLVKLGEHDLLSNPSKVNAGLNGIWNWKVQAAMAFLIENYNPRTTVVHVHSWLKSLSSSVFFAAMRSGFEVVVTLHDYFMVCPNGGFFDYQKHKICTLNPMSLSCVKRNCDSRSYAYKMWRIMRQLVGQSRGVPSKLRNFICVSTFSAEILRGYLPRHARIWDVPNPIDIGKGDKSEPHRSDVFTFVGRLAREKGPHIFAEAAKIANVKIRIIGDGELKKELLESFPGAEFAGWVARDRMQELTKNSRSVVFPTELFETQGLVVYEAAALGLPVIVADHCAARDYVEDGQTGLLYKGGNVKSLASKMELLAKDAQLAACMGSNAYKKFWLSPPDLENHINKLVNCYLEILG